ncbi:MAG: histidine kinase [Proteobacteria bacterium]|nr:MAG: histidine kinase [Pseudomonadota bacterium]PIE40236.1 MAG: histidine kinase [Gammaproteobacteria bacterium]
MSIVKSVMQTNLVTTSPDNTVSEVAEKMKEYKLGAILLVDNDGLFGIFTERDLLNRVVAEGKDPASTKVSEVATKDPIVVRENAHIKDCALILKNEGFRHLPVVNEDNAHVGIVSSRDFFQYMTDELENVIDKIRTSGDPIQEDFDIYELVGGGGYGIPPGR